MAVAFRSVTSASGLSPSLPSGTTTDDIVLAIYSCENTGASVTAPSGDWTAINTDTDVAASGVTQHRTWWARKTASALSSTWTDGGAGGTVCLITYSGCKTTGSPINTSSYSEGTDNSAEFSSITLTAADCMIVGLLNVFGWSASSSATFDNERLDQGEAISIYDDGILASGSTPTLTVTCGSVWGATLVALEPPSGGPDVTVNASLLTGTLSLLTATVTVGNPVTVNASLLTGTLSLPALPVPTFVAAGTAAFTATNAATIAPGLPSGWAADDIHVLLAARSDNTAMTDLSGSGWTQIAALSGNNTVAQRVEVWWRRAVGGDAAPTITFGSSTVVRGARIYGVRGCPTTGDPFDTPSRLNNAASATVSTTNITPARATLGLFLYAYEDDPTAASAPTNWGAFAVSTSSLGNDMALGASVRTFIFGASYGTPTSTVSGGTFANSVNVGILLPMLAPVGVVVRPGVLDLTTTLATATATGESGGGVTVNAALLTDTLTLFDPAISAVQNISVTPSLLSASLSLTTPTVSATQNATVSPALLTVTLTLPTPTVSTVRNATSSPSLQVATLSLFSPTVTAVRNTTASPSALTAAFTLPTATTSVSDTITPSLLTATFSLPTPTVSAGGNVTVSPGLLTATLSLFAPTVSAVQNATSSPSALTATLSLPQSTVSAVQTATATPALLTATLSLPAATVSAVRNVTASPSTLPATLTLFAPSVTTGGSVTVSPSLLTATLSLHAPTVTTVKSITVSPSALTAAFTLLAPAVSVADTVTPSLLTATFSLFTPTVTAVQRVTVTPAALTATVSLSNPTVSAGGSITVTPAALSLTLSLPTPAVSISATVTPDVLSLAAAITDALVTTTRNVEATPAMLLLAIELLTARPYIPPNEVPATVSGGSVSLTGVSGGGVSLTSVTGASVTLASVTGGGAP